MQTRKEYAHSLGLANSGRGRMSREAHAAIAKAEANGMKFKDSKAVGVVRDSTPTGPVVSKDEPKREAEGINVYAEAFRRFPDDQMFWYNDAKGKRRVVNGKGVCRNCGFSLVGHTCTDATPTILTAHGWQAVTPVGE